jgi:hypothetical protein
MDEVVVAVVMSAEVVVAVVMSAGVTVVVAMGACAAVFSVGTGVDAASPSCDVETIDVTVALEMDCD